MRVGYPFYGQNIGVLVFSTTTPRISGDAGNSGTFNYPVCYEVVEGGFQDLINGSDEIKQNLLNAAYKLKQKGIKAIIGDCGLMSLYQKEISQSSKIPVAASALCQVPMIWQSLGQSGEIGIITGHSKLLSERHLEQSGCNGIPLVIQGLEDEAHFTEIVINGGLNLDSNKMREDVLNGARKLKEKSNNIRAIVFECSNLPTYSKDIHEYLDLPVFDIISAANFLEYSVNPPIYI